MQNSFLDSDKKRAWLDHPFCAKCKSNINCALHHIYGRKVLYADSIMNSIMLCGVCHKEADCFNNSSPLSEQFRSDLLKLSLPIILNSGYNMKDGDKKFLFNHKDSIL